MKNWLILSVGVCMIACMQEEPEIGSDFFGQTSFEITSWDTLSMKMYTVAYDSLPTSLGARLLIGQVDHSDLGSVSSHSYFQLSPSEGYSISGDHIEFVNAYLTLIYDGYYYGDTLSSLSLEVFEVIEELELDDDNVIYNSETFEIKSDTLGTYEFSPRPYSYDSIHIPLHSTFVSGLFDFLQAEEVATNDFLDLFRGVRISSKSAGAIVGFQPTPRLNINYLDKSESPSIERTLTLSVQSGQIQYNQITGEKATTLFADLDDGVLSTTDSDHRAYVQSGTGLATRIELPYLKTLLSTDETPLLDEVKLELVFENKIPEEVYMLVDGLTLSKVNKNNELLLEYTTIPELVVDLEYKEQRKIVIDIKAFVEEQLDITTPENNDALMIKFSNEIYQNSVDHLILMDQEGDGNSKIILSELKIKE
ncbi:DUF4270 domain-containing protein [Reichenbachiella carrageenanivorans]|uniref:DUF4270 domain-containing protein n=1 Tax=Reichenbachiella carrageenanivorans TaxID=2979869 RepID=A0ABY6CZN7_9BACT|nr:DUF4270 domain-containing protein [Reichenbachiella carrageenanivorans]UXX79164.1 DUF4270 domain-containing protein [Reichenbachiella carrageenanivorans]